MVFLLLSLFILLLVSVDCCIDDIDDSDDSDDIVDSVCAHRGNCISPSMVLVDSTASMAKTYTTTMNNMISTAI